MNDAPVAQPQSIAVLEDATSAIKLAGRDVDSDALTFEMVTAPAHGALTGTPPTLVYTPEPNFFGTDTFRYTVGDGAATSELATVQLNVSNVNDPPVASAQTLAVNEDSTNAFALRATDPDGDLLFYSVASTPMHGTLSGDGANLGYRPSSNYHGTDKFTFNVSDGTLTVENVEVAITIAPVEDASSADLRADIFALGVMAYKMVTAQYPFGSHPGPVLYRKQVHELPARPDGVPAAAWDRTQTARHQLRTRETGLPRMPSRILVYYPTS